MLQDARDEKELEELIKVYKRQESEIHEIRARLARFMTKGAPLLPLTRPVTSRPDPARGILSYRRNKSKSRSSTTEETSSGSTKGVVPKSIEEPKKKSVTIKKKRPKSSKVVTLSATEMKNETRGFPAAASGSRDSQSMEKHGGLFVQSTKLSLSSSSSSSSVHKPHSKHRKNT